jgi:hypothetical protein
MADFFIQSFNVFEGLIIATLRDWDPVEIKTQDLLW